jgi:hypothetical protein
MTPQGMSPGAAASSSLLSPSATTANLSPASITDSSHSSSTNGSRHQRNVSGADRYHGAGIKAIGSHHENALRTARDGNQLHHLHQHQHQHHHHQHHSTDHQHDDFLVINPAFKDHLLNLDNWSLGEAFVKEFPQWKGSFRLKK